MSLLSWILASDFAWKRRVANHAVPGQSKQELHELCKYAPSLCVRRDITDSIKLQTETAELSVPMIEKQFKELTFLRMDMAGDKGVAALYDVFTEIPWSLYF